DSISHDRPPLRPVRPLRQVEGDLPEMWLEGKMMQQVNGDLIVSASDLNAYLACRHLTVLNLAYARGDRSVTPRRSPDAELIARKGDEHEAAYLQSLKDHGREVVEITMPDRALESLRVAASATEEAMRNGADVIYQGTFFRDGLRGHADFLFRIDRPSDLGNWSYEVADTKLARRAKPYFILQLCFYSELLHAVQGGEPPERIHMTTRPPLPITEEEANTFAAALLMPARLIREHYPRLRDHGDMCELFGASGAAMGRRLHAVLRPGAST
ncbi:MAG: ImmA/IrrE family metallo-endopeptidase, partial [Acidimicrobiia bacterium]